MTEKAKEKTVLVIGLGEIGKPLYNLIAKGSADVVGIDIERISVDRPVSLMHVCYPFVSTDRFVKTTVEYCAKYRPETVIVNSTVLPGTTRAIETSTKIPCVFSPVRGKHTKMEADLLHYTKFVGGTDRIAVEQVERHLQSVGMKTQAVTSPETLELAKLLETTYFGLLIAWAQEMDRFSKQYNADYLELAQFFGEIAYLPPKIFQPGFIGGHCVMPNIGLLKSRFQSEFLDAILHSNERRARELGDGAKEPRVEPIQPTVGARSRNNN